MAFVCYEVNTGRIVSYSGDPDALAAAYESPEIAVILNVGDILGQIHLLYVADDDLMLRPEQATQTDKAFLSADGADVINITGAPSGAHFTAINTATDEVVSGSISGADTFATTSPGWIKLTVEKFPYLTWEAVIHAI